MTGSGPSAIDVLANQFQDTNGPSDLSEGLDLSMHVIEMVDMAYG